MRTTIKDAAEKLGLPEQSLRCWIKTGRCPFGSVLIEKKGKGGRNTYYVCTERLESYLRGEVSNVVEN